MTLIVKVFVTCSLIIIAQSSAAIDIVVEGLTETPPYLPGLGNSAPHIGLALTIRLINVPPGATGIISSADIETVESNYQNPGYPTVAPTDDGGHANHDERKRNGVHLSLQQNDFPVFPRPRNINLRPNLENTPLTFYFYPPEMSGSYKLFITGGNESHYLDPIVYEINIKVPNLVQLNATAGSWSLTGEKPKHPSNHFALQSTITLLSNFRSQWLTISPNAPAWVINDASLKWGGLFDFNKDQRPDWIPPHFDHRDGKALDISDRTVPVSDRNRLYHFLRGDPISSGGTPANIIRFTGPVPRLVLYGPPDHTTHYHVEEF